RGRNSLHESDKRLDLRSAGRDVVLANHARGEIMATQDTMGNTDPRGALCSATPNYTRPLIIVTTLFLMWGFLTCLNDILVPHLKSIFDLSYARAMLIQFAFFSAYFLFSVPWSKVVNRLGYQRSMVAGLLTMALGAFLFLPAAGMVSYPLF